MGIFPVVSSILFIAVGLICLLSSYYQWVWLWHLNGLGKIFYNRFGHESTRLFYGFMGVAFIATAIRDLIDSILATTWGKVLFVALLLLAGGSVFYFKYVRRAKFSNIEQGESLDKNNTEDIESHRDK